MPEPQISIKILQSKVKNCEKLKKNLDDPGSRLNSYSLYIGFSEDKNILFENMIKAIMESR